MRGALVLGLSMVMSAQWASAQDVAKEKRRRYGLTGIAELGFLAVPSHTIQFGKDGTEVDYVDEGGQDILFPVARLSVNLLLAERHHVTLLYQPLNIESEVVAKRDLTIDGLVFPAGTPMKLRYGFPFWRASYFYDLIESPKHELSLGGALQIRDATITFASADGKLLRTNRSLGPVPLLSARGRYSFENGVWLGFELEGFYAPISYLNGSDTEVTGAIIDTSVRVGWQLTDRLGAFLNVRYLGGGAVGQSDDDDEPGDGFVRNWLHFMTITLGASFEVI